MKTKIYILVLLFLAVMGIMNAQKSAREIDVKLSDFNSYFWNAYADKLHLTPAERSEFLLSHQKNNIEFKQKLDQPAISQAARPNQPNTISAGCNNIDFENGTLNGWTASSGFHPLYAANPSGCCLSPGGQQTIMTGTGLDPAGNFPVVAPGGSFSLRLGNNQTGGQADRIEQTFLVTPANANFTYKYAVVMEDPGHSLAQQPSFQVEMLDSSGALIPCTYYNVAAGNNIPGFINSPNLPNVVYKPWSSVVADLTGLIGQIITIRFTSFDCSLGGHFGYAYVDGDCMSFMTGINDTICAGMQKAYCAPNGFLSTTWNGPGMVNNTSQCVTLSTPGIYTCQTVLVPGCPGPDFTYTLSNFPQPNVSFSQVSVNACTPQYTFNNTSSVSIGSLSTYTWSSGSLTGNSQNFVRNFGAVGTHTVGLSVTTDKGCISGSVQTVTVFPFPAAAFSVSPVCQGLTVMPVNTSSVSIGNILNYTWNNGNGTFSNLSNPTFLYPQNGNYVITLSVTSNQNCSASFSTSLVIHPLPQVFFTAGDVCQGTNSIFSNNTALSSGFINTWSWDYGNSQGINGVQNPSYQYPSAGNYTVTLTATSNKNCTASYSRAVKVFSNPVVTFAAKSVCLGEATTFTNNSSIASPEQLASYNWVLGNGSSSAFINPSVTYSAGGSYPVKLTVTSGNNCSSSLTLPVTVHHLPQVSFIPTSACKDQATQFTNQSTIVSGAIAKSRWDFENDGTWDDTTNMNPVRTYPNHGNYACRLEVESNFQCKSAKTKNVTVHANPVADFNSRAVCLGDITTFENQSTSVDGVITSYQWDFNGDNIIDNISKNASVTYSANGTYLVKLEVQTQFGCTNVKSRSGYINAMPSPGFISKNAKGCPQLNVRFQNNSTIAGGSIVSYLWNFGDGLTDQSQNPVHAYQVGTYNVSLKVVSDSGCIAEIKQPAFVTVYPLPVAGFAVNPEELDENEPMVHVKSNAVNATFTSFYLNDGTKVIANQFDHSFKNIDQTKPMIVQIVKNEYGCADTTFQVLKVKPAFVIYIPNTFTPNGDGVNDDFQAKGVGIVRFNMQIFDRWGHVLFESNDINNPWDGRARGSAEPIMQDVYVWKATVMDLFNKAHDLEGHVSLLR